MASGLGVGGGAGVGVVVPGPGVGRLPLLAEGLLGPPLCPSGVSGGPAAPLAGGCWVLVFFGLRVLRLWCGRRLRFGVWRAFVGLVSVAVVGVCVVCMRGRVCGVLVVRLGACPRLSGLGLAALCGCGGCVSWPLSRLGCVVPRPPWLGSVGGVSPRRPLCVPSSFCLFSASLGAVFPWCRARAFAVVVGGGGSLSSARVPSPGVSPWGGPMLALPVRVELCCTGRPFVPARYTWTCSVARYSSHSPHRGRVHCGSQGSACGIGVSLACPDGRCALPTAPRWARTAVRAVGSALGQAHWSPPQAGATAGR